jgi:hypothetical protein
MRFPLNGMGKVLMGKLLENQKFNVHFTDGTDDISANRLARF